MSIRTPVLKTILGYCPKKWWKLQHKKKTELLNCKMLVLKSVKLTAERKDKTSTNHLILQPDTKWTIWHVLVVYPRFLQVYTASTSGHRCSLALFPTHLKQLIKLIAKIQLSQIPTDSKYVPVTVNTNLCFLIRGLRLVNQPWHLPQLGLSHWVNDFLARGEDRCPFSLDDLIRALKKPSETKKKPNQTTKPNRTRLLFSCVRPLPFTGSLCSMLKVMEKKNPLILWLKVYIKILWTI